MDPRETDTLGAAGCTVRTDVVDGVARVRVAGELDLLAAPLFARALAGALRGRSGALVVDLAGVTLLTSNGIRVLVDARDDAERAGARLRVAGVTGNRPVARVFALLRLDEAFEIEDDGPGGAAAEGVRRR